MQPRQILASTCRQRILETLAKTGEMHIMELVRRTNSTYNEIRRNLEILEKENVVSMKRYGRMKTIKINKESEKASVLLKALHVLNRPIPKSENVTMPLRDRSQV